MTGVMPGYTPPTSATGFQQLPQNHAAPGVLQSPLAGIHPAMLGNIIAALQRMPQFRGPQRQMMPDPGIGMAPNFRPPQMPSGMMAALMHSPMAAM
jgi:hypothetical protein